jgi:hypothetical protein
MLQMTNLIDRKDEIGEALYECENILCIDVDKVDCSGVMEYSHLTEMWTCSHCNIELDEDSLNEIVEEQELEMSL